MPVFIAQGTADTTVELPVTKRFAKALYAQGVRVSFVELPGVSQFTRLQKQEEGPMATQDSPSLYERLGGVYSIATAVDDFIDRIMVDPRLNANPRVDEGP